MAIAVASAATAATVTTAITASAATFSHGRELGDLLCCGLANLQYRTAEVQGLACQRVVEVHHDDVLFYLQYGAIHAMALRVHHRNGVAFLDHLGIELAVYLEDVLRQIQYVLFLVFAIRIGRSD